MFNDHSKASIAQIVFYVPVTIMAAYLACYRHQRPRWSWIILLIFCAIRITAGVLVIVFNQNPSTGLMIASIILLNVGLFPLIGATLGLIRIIIAHEEEIDKRVRQCLVLSRVLFLVGIALAVAGGCLEGSDEISDVNIGLKLVKAGYSVVVVFLACLVVAQAYFWTRLSDLSRTSQTILKAMALALPFIIVRITYLFLSSLHGSDRRWNDLTGPIAPFLVMGLLMEYVVVCIYLVTGFIIPPWRNVEGKARLSASGCLLVEDSSQV
ncbi:hypothetical protein BDV28DRAFT_5354 [Aspergillus coremiiformis]|uniref:DUF7702 domain-containing protein n=1 Tax=Aspergillus coremiiformis TaxID=138285 RepID=A0A5N6Z456_9EURO|nr:hypothetical protein BDV28DRAFT_5354 [Aspergillus coremiiformis]